MIRGGLVLAAHDRLGGRRSPDAMKTAAALELFHSAFLVHDDIMDDDPCGAAGPASMFNTGGKRKSGICPARPDSAGPRPSAPATC